MHSFSSRIKIFLYVLLKDIEFWMDPSMVIEKKVNVVTRPYVKSEPQLGNQMPLYMRRASNISSSSSGLASESSFNPLTPSPMSPPPTGSPSYMSPASSVSVSSVSARSAFESPPPA
ncbi:hypothetical protein BDN72DRAFT_543320 [Pluteus cervinus]|uniref:Uncharacterized protein n=1 Tax=Pluteus cervinus TaxID=181527 RepID=A0ACD3AX88_9AGAR|nr:hypothetical protein BDN72DRAFT_543320 [Pluteus cervinus]